MMNLVVSLIFLLVSMYLYKFIYVNMLFKLWLYLVMLLLIFNFPFMSNLWLKVSLFMGLDVYSWGLMNLSIWIVLLVLIMSYKIMIKSYKIIYLFMMNFMLIFLLLCFCTVNFMVFYFFFESSLIPMFMLILGWGGQMDRIQASFYMMLYTLFGSMPLFFMILYFYGNYYTSMFMLLNLSYLNVYMYMLLMLAFFIKLPLFMFHMWLPKAHVEAPTGGSMILAGIMLKLGSYGIFRFLIVTYKFCLKFNQFVILFSLMGGIYSSMICLNQVDMKMLIAYSSVVHMSLMLAGMLTLFKLGMMGGYLMMIAHGLGSSGLFNLVGIIYDRSFSRSLYINKGLLSFYPILVFMSFLLCSSNMSFPPSLNLFSEILLFGSLVIWSKLVIIILFLINFLCAVYMLYFYGVSHHGNFNFQFYLVNIKVSEYMSLVLHWVPLNLFFVLVFYMK